METIIIRDVSTPRLGFGTFRMPGGGCQPVVESALARNRFVQLQPANTLTL
jgi:2,5-diketo-D-gluconate reductase B